MSEDYGIIDYVTGICRPDGPHAARAGSGEGIPRSRREVRGVVDDYYKNSSRFFYCVRAFCHLPNKFSLRVAAVSSRRLGAPFSYVPTTVSAPRPTKVIS